MAHRYLITGANGFLGRKLLEGAAGRGFGGIALIQPGTADVRVHGWETRPVAFSDSRGMRDALTDVDVVINLAGNMLGATPSRFRAANVETVRDLLEAAAAVPNPPRLVHASSVAVFGPALAGTPLDEKAPCRPVCLYGQTKLAGERLILASGLANRALILRLCSVYGPHDRCFLDLFRMAGRGWFLKLATLTKRFQLTFVDDLVNVLWRLADDPGATGVLNVGNPEVSTDEGLRQALGRAAGVGQLGTIFLPRGATLLLGRLCDLAEVCTNSPNLMSSGKAREMSFPNWLQDFSAVNRRLPGLPWTPLADGIARTFAWYQREGWL